MSAEDLLGLLGWRSETVSIAGQDIEVREISAAGRVAIRDLYQRRDAEQKENGESAIDNLDLAAVWVKYGVPAFFDVELSTLRTTLTDVNLVALSIKVSELSKLSIEEAKKNLPIDQT